MFHSPEELGGGLTSIGVVGRPNTLKKPNDDLLAQASSDCVDVRRIALIERGNRLPRGFGIKASRQFRYKVGYLMTSKPWFSFANRPQERRLESTRSGDCCQSTQNLSLSTFVEIDQALGWNQFLVLRTFGGFATRRKSVELE
jgi:hypothetical protein